MGLVGPLGDVALDEFGALIILLALWLSQIQLGLCTHSLSSCSNFLPFSTSGSPMQTLALIYFLVSQCMSSVTTAYHTLQPPGREHKPLLDHLHLIMVIKCSLNWKMIKAIPPVTIADFPLRFSMSRDLLQSIGPVCVYPCILGCFSELESCPEYGRGFEKDRIESFSQAFIYFMCAMQCEMLTSNQNPTSLVDPPDNH